MLCYVGKLIAETDPGADGAGVPAGRTVSQLASEAKKRLTLVTREIVNIAPTLEHNRLLALRDIPQDGIEHKDNICTFLCTDCGEDRLRGRKRGGRCACA